MIQELGRALIYDDYYYSSTTSLSGGSFDLSVAVLKREDTYTNTDGMVPSIVTVKKSIHAKFSTLLQFTKLFSHLNRKAHPSTVLHGQFGL